MGVKMSQGACVLALVFVAVLGSLRTGWAQEAAEDVLIELPEPGSKKLTREPLDVIKLKADALKLATEGARRHVLALHGRPDAMHEIRQAAAAVNDAEDEDSKRQAQETLEDLLDRYFDEDMRRRERELAQIEERVKKLSALLERRRERRRDIVDLQVKVLLSEAEGMGFFSSGTFDGGENPWEMRVEAYPGLFAPARVPGAPYVPQPPRSGAVPVAAPAPAAAPPATAQP
jgi:hypothetical protein